MKNRNTGVPRETLSSLLLDASRQMGLTLTGSQHAALLDYLELLLKWNAIYNLTAIRKPEEMVQLHLVDSLAVYPAMAELLGCLERPTVLDIGAGAGLPGLVLAIMNPMWKVSLVDAVQKKVAFMTQVIGQLKLRNAQAYHARVEQLTLPAQDAVISRAFSDLNLFSSLAAPHLRPGGLLLAMQGKADDRAVPGYQRHSMLRLHVPGLEAERHLFVLTRLED